MQVVYFDILKITMEMKRTWKQTEGTTKKPRFGAAFISLRKIYFLNVLV